MFKSCQKIIPDPKHFENFRKNRKTVRVSSAPRPTPKLEDYPLSAVRDCLSNIFAATLRTRRTSFHPQPENIYFNSVNIDWSYNLHSVDCASSAYAYIL